MNPVPTQKLQHVFTKHAADFGVTGRWNQTNALRFEQTLHDHVNNPSMTVINGSYRGTKHVMHYYDPSTDLNVMVDPSNELESAWRLSPSQVHYLLTTGNVQ
jgi:Colicin D